MASTKYTLNFARRRPPTRRALRIAAALGVAIMLSGCVVVPAGPGYYHHHYWY